MDLESRLMLFYLGTSRVASEIASKVVANLPNKQAVLHRMSQMVRQALSILNSQQDLEAFGRLLHEAWMLKRELSSAVTNSAVDHVYEIAINHGALGGKLLGAGSTGFMVFYVPPEKQHSVKEAFSTYLHVPFKFENEGSSLIYYAANDLAGMTHPTV
jgi:D-glycero-alpha-D-manno-heptose-7-phosphate kinase